MIRTERRVQAFVILAIAIFLAGGIAANRYVTAAQSSPVRDAVVPPSPEGSAVTPSMPVPSPKATFRRPRTHRPAPKPTGTKARTKTHPMAMAAPVKGLSAEDEAVRLTNAQRAQHGCAPLRADSRLRTAARRHSVDMHLRHYFEHNSLDGTSPWTRIKAAGYRMPGAENIAQGYPTAQTVVQGWMRSPGHRANILNCGLKAVGIGVDYGQGGPWWTQDFGYR